MSFDNDSLHNNKNTTQFTRKEFLTVFSKATAGTALLAMPAMSEAKSFFMDKANITVGEIMDLFIKEVPNAPFAETVDTLKSGNRDIVVTGIVTTMFATIDVIRKAIEAKANFIIAHEPTFYSHEDKTDWLQDNDVYEYKADLLKQHNIAVWRNHDYIHGLKVDGVGEGVLKQLGWTSYYDGNDDAIVTIPAMNVGTLIKHAKEKLDIKQVKYIGDPSQSCSKVLLLPGASGGTTQITLLNKTKPDVLVCGEIHEWETAEYIRDARAKGEKVSLVVLGHIASEEPGSEWMKTWLEKNVPGIPVTHIHPGNSLSFA